MNSLIHRLVLYVFRVLITSSNERHAGCVQLRLGWRASFTGHEAARENRYRYVLPWTYTGDDRTPLHGFLVEAYIRIFNCISNPFLPFPYILYPDALLIKNALSYFLWILALFVWWLIFAALYYFFLELATRCEYKTVLTFTCFEYLQHVWNIWKCMKHLKCFLNIIYVFWTLSNVFETFATRLKHLKALYNKRTLNSVSYCMLMVVFPEIKKIKNVLWILATCLKHLQRIWNILDAF